jgi:hypothetical protein
LLHPALDKSSFKDRIPHIHNASFSTTKHWGKEQNSESTKIEPFNKADEVDRIMKKIGKNIRIYSGGPLSLNAGSL